MNQIRRGVLDGAGIAPGRTILDYGNGDGRLALEPEQLVARQRRLHMPVVNSR